MALLTLLDAQLAYGALPLLDRAAFSLESGERVGLIGRNGTGKSSLLSVIAGRAVLDEGEARLREGARVVLVEQEPSLPASLPQDHRTRAFLHRFGLPEDFSGANASGGETKRAALALAFALEPDLLLLDEPTNHLDIGGIETLEGLLLKVPSAIVVTHDRAFLDRVCTRIFELDRGGLRLYPGNFSAYERLKADELVAESVASRKFDKFWKEEEAWIRKGIEARRTRNEGRVRRLERLSAIDRSVLRLAAAELRLGETPFKVVIKEAVHLAERFGTHESARFANGVLDALARRMGRT